MKDSEDKILGDGIDGFSDDLRPSESRVRGMYREYFLDYATVSSRFKEDFFTH
jgi:hypothetical protein